jgi:short-chain fatty acids transporter
MSIAHFVEKAFKRFLPSPFSIAVLLTLLTMLLALVFTPATSNEPHALAILSYWERGIWNEALLVFAYQMMLILVLGHVLVLSRPMARLIGSLTQVVHSTSSAALLVSSTTLTVAFFNWGLALIFGAIMARKVAEAAQRRNFPINYPLVGASGYIGLMVWHGGMSGSAPLKVAESGHLSQLMTGMTATKLPSFIPFSDTVFSSSNLILYAILLVLLPLGLFLLGKRVPTTSIALPMYRFPERNGKNATGAERLEYSKFLAFGFGALLLVAFAYQYTASIQTFAITPNLLNFFMLGLGIVLHGNFKSFLSALDEAIRGTSGILIQFPLYFGIMGIMRDSGMVTQISNFFVSIANEDTLPLFTFFSGALVNIFVPSGGGQWAVQGPIVVESATRLGVPLPKLIMALAYGDQITNMLQPFWALPLLAITKLKAQEILPYTLLLMVAGAAVFLLGLWFLY